MPLRKSLTITVIFLCAATAWAQQAPRDPHIGYLYPGGGQQGETFEIVVGGQYLRGAKNIHVSGEGVRARIVKYFKPLNNIMKEQRDELTRRFVAIRAERLAELPTQEQAVIAAWQNTGLKLPNAPRPSAAKVTAKTPSRSKNKTTAKKNAPAPTTLMPEHPVLHDLENKNLSELRHAAYEIFFPRTKKQTNAQIGESVLLEISIDPGATLGDREFRVETATGLTNPMVFQVCSLPETRELEPNDPTPNPTAGPTPWETVHELPILLNGQIMPGDVDRFRFRANQGQKLVMETSARRLIPFLADTVPGWFQPTLTLFDSKGKELAFVDDYRFDPDPVLFIEIPKTGVYEIEIRDSIYRGREDFIYRVAIGEQPFITSVYPLGGRAGEKTEATVDGWNLKSKTVELNTQPGGDAIRQTASGGNKSKSNDVFYAVGELPEIEEKEPNDLPKYSQKMVTPLVVNGRLSRAGDVDVFRVEGRAGEEIVAEVQARRLHSPLDSLLRLTDLSGKTIAWNDDFQRKEGHLNKGMEFMTHHADSYLTARLPADGVYFVHLSDTRGEGGDAFAYRLRVGPPRADFELFVTPSTLNVVAGRAIEIVAHVLRKDGFDGEIELAFQGAPAGFELQGARIPPGRDTIRATLLAPWKSNNATVVLRLEGRASVGGRTITRPAVPADDMMQAFLWRHLAPCCEMMVAVQKSKYRAPTIEVASSVPVQIPEGGVAELRINVPKFQSEKNFKLELREPPKGVTIQKTSVGAGSVTLSLKSDGKEALAGLADNLIIEAFSEIVDNSKKGAAGKTTRLASVGILPAVPFKIVAR